MPALGHARHDRLTKVERTAQVDIEHALPTFVFQRFNTAETGWIAYAGYVGKNVYRSEFIMRAGDGQRHGIAGCNVAFDRYCLAAEVTQRRGGFLGCLRTNIERRDARAFARKAIRGSATYAAAGTGYQRGSIEEA